MAALAESSGSITSSNLIGGTVHARPEGRNTFQLQLDTARQLRREKATEAAVLRLESLLDSPDAPAEVKGPAMLELAVIAHQENQLPKAIQIYAQFAQTFPEDPAVPEVLLRQGLIYRTLGAHTNALNKFFSVLSSSLLVKFERLEYYQRLVLQAQSEIADTYSLQGKYEEATYNYRRLLRLEAPDLNRVQIQFKLLQALARLDRHGELIPEAELYLTQHPADQEEPEVRYLLATSLKRLGRNQEAMRQVLVLLETQNRNPKITPEEWVQWQQRTGNDIANQLYKEGDYTSALQIYQQLSLVDHSPAWEIPVLYQVGLVLERMRQPLKACETYERIVGREKDVAAGPVNPTLSVLIDMARWRKSYLTWQTNVELASHELRLPVPITNAMAVVR